MWRAFIAYEYNILHHFIGIVNKNALKCIKFTDQILIERQFCPRYTLVLYLTSMKELSPF